MDHVTEIVALLRKQADLEITILSAERSLSLPSKNWRRLAGGYSPARRH
jgi:hypothetical protein